MDCPSFIYFFGEEIFIIFYSLDHEPLLVKGFPSFIFLLAFCWLNQSFAIATINIKVEVGSIPFKHLISKAELDCAMQVTLCQRVSPHSVKLTKTCYSVFFSIQKLSVLFKAKSIHRILPCTSSDHLKTCARVNSRMCLSLDSSRLAQSHLSHYLFSTPSPTRCKKIEWLFKWYKSHHQYYCNNTLKTFH